MIVEHPGHLVNPSRFIALMDCFFSCKELWFIAFFSLWASFLAARLQVSLGWYSKPHPLQNTNWHVSHSKRCASEDEDEDDDDEEEEREGFNRQTVSHPGRGHQRAFGSWRISVRNTSCCKRAKSLSSSSSSMSSSLISSAHPWCGHLMPITLASSTSTLR